MIKKKRFIILISFLLLSSLVFYLLNPYDTKHLLQSTPFWVEKDSNHHLSLERYLAKYHTDESAYLAASQYVSSNDLKKKYLNIALEKKTNLSLVYEVTILSHPGLSKKERNDFIDEWISKEPKNPTARLFKLTQYLNDKNFEKAYQESQKVIFKDISFNKKSIYKHLISIHQQLGATHLRSKIVAYGIILSLQTRHTTPWTNSIDSLRENKTTKDPLEKEKKLSMIFTYAKALNKRQTLIDKMIANALEIQYWQQSLKNNKKLGKTIKPRIAQLRQKDKCFDLLQKSFNSDYTKSLSRSELEDSIDKSIFFGEYKAILSFKKIKKILLKEKCFMDEFDKS